MQNPRVVDIEQQIAHLRWRRQQNERAIRNSIESSKVLKQKDVILGLSVDQSTEKAMWTNNIVRDELTRPLIVKDHELHQIEYDENKVKQRLLKYSGQQLDNVKKQLDIKKNWQVKTDAGKKIRDKQMHNLEIIKQKLETNIMQIESRVPYIEVKTPIKKLF